MGLIHEVFADQKLDYTIEHLLGQILNNGPDAIRVSKKLVEAVTNQQIDTALIDYTSKVIADIRSSTEGQEGLDAFLAKRQPSWCKD